MYTEIEHFGTGWSGILLCLRNDEIDKLIASLQRLKQGDIGHFHIRSIDNDLDAGIADIEISIAGDSDVDNMRLW